jgi:general L-amino acid transport system permease protein
MSALEHQILISELPPRNGSRGGFAWARANLFARPIDMILTSAIAIAALALIWAIVPWALLDAVWVGESRAACRPDAACWAFIVKRGGQFLYGFYPPAERWRVNAVFLAFAVSLIILLSRRVPGKKAAAAFLILVFPVLAYGLLHGGVAGLPRVTTDKWGGLSLTLLLGVAGIVASFPVAIVLALGRQSAMPVLRWASIGYIEICRGLPLIAVLFMARILLPYAFPVGTEFDPLALAVVGIILFESAYLAEVFRGGFQAIPKGQAEAAAAIGFGYWRTAIYVTLPQMLRVVVPGVVNNAIALLKNTTLVVILGLFEVLNIVAAGAADPDWLGLHAEGYVFVGLVFWVLCFSMSRYSQSLERELKAADRS